MGLVGTHDILRLTSEQPSICQDCYEVSEDVADAFYREFHGPGHGEAILLSKGNGKYQLNLWRANQIVLEEAGVLPEKIQVSIKKSGTQSA